MKKNFWVPVTLRIPIREVRETNTAIFEDLFGASRMGKGAPISIAHFRDTVGFRFSGNLDRLTRDPQFQAFAKKLIEQNDTFPFFGNSRDLGYQAMVRAWYLAANGPRSFKTEDDMSQFQDWAEFRLLGKFRRASALIRRLKVTDIASGEGYVSLAFKEPGNLNPRLKDWTI